MSYFRLFSMNATDVPTPPSGKFSFFFDASAGDEPSYKDSAGVVTSLVGIPGPGVPTGGTTGQVLSKIDGTDYNTQWSTPVSYTGTAGSITLTGSAFSIDATYVGQTSIVTVGTIATGTWNATAISAVKGGTGQTGYAVGDLLYASSTTALSKLAAGTNGYVLTLAAGVPTWAAASGSVAWGAITGTLASQTDLQTVLDKVKIQSIQIACSDLTTNITTGTGKGYFRMPYAFTLTDVRASVFVAQTAGSILTFDINENGTTILSTKLTIDNSEKTSTTAATPPVISDVNLADDSEITVDFDVVGTALAKGVVITLIGYRP